MFQKLIGVLSLAELYRLTGEFLGQGAYASVQTCVNIWTDVEYAVKVSPFRAIGEGAEVTPCV